MTEASDGEPRIDLAAGAQEARSELREYLHAQQERKQLFPKAILVGLAAGFVAVAFRAMLVLGDALRNRIVHWAHTEPAAGWLAPTFLGIAGAVMSMIVVRKWAPETSGSGIPHLEAVLHRHRTLDWKRVLPAKFLGGVAAIGSGMALGREGPTVQMGGATGMALSRLLKMSKRDSMTLTAAGAGAGLAAAFNAPLAGLIFVLEELQKDFRPMVFGAAFLAAASADLVTRLFAGQLPVFAVQAYPPQALGLLPAFLVLGILSGFLGVAYNRALVASLNAFARVGSRFTLLAAAGVGACVGLSAYFAPDLVGGGNSLTQAAATGAIVLAVIPGYFALRFFLTMISYGVGAPGGIFAPLLALGALLGLFVGHLAVLVAPNLAVQPGVFAVVGMAAYFTAIVRAPLTGIVLIVEMTASYTQMLPLLVACFCAYAVAEAMGDLPVYEALLQRDLLKGGITTSHDEPIVLELEIEPGAPFDGRQVRDLRLPSGVVLVSCRQGDREWVPTAGTKLEAYVRVTAVVSPDSERGLEAFREGCDVP
jgi:CIC family chloride channel protein